MMATAESSPLVFVCVLNWNNYRDTAECLGSLSGVRYPNYRVILIDNASTDGSRQRLAREYPWAIHLANSRNLGFAGGSNVGIRYAMDQDGDYVFLVNNDAIVDPAVISELVKTAESDGRIGIVGPAIYSHADRRVFWAAGMEKNVPDGKIFPQYLMRGKGSIDRGQYGDVEDVEMINGCALMIRREAIEKVGLLDEKFFLYNEDTDWNDRAASAGYRIVYVPGAKVWHKGSVSTGGECSPESWFYTVRNELFFLMKRSKWRDVPALWADYLRENYWFWMGFKRKGDEDRATAVLDGIWSGLIGRGGPRKRRAPRWLSWLLDWKMLRDIRKEAGEHNS